jgi:histidinol dehydrogenase
VTDFVKLTSVITVDDALLDGIGPAAKILAEAEGLEAHARAIGKRLRAGE